MARTMQVNLTVSAKKGDFPKDGDGRNWVLIYDGEKKIWQAIDRDLLFKGITNRLDKLIASEKAFETDAIAKRKAFEADITAKEKEMEDKEDAYEKKVNSTVSETLALIEPLVKENKE